MEASTHKPVEWIASAKKDLMGFPREVQRAIGYALGFAQRGDKHESAKPLKGFGGAGILAIVEDFDGDAYRAVYAVRFPQAIYVLHAFRKKAHRGRTTPPQEIKLVRARLKVAEADYAENYGGTG